MVAVVAAVLLGAAFVVAGASKLAARESWPVQALGLGAPAWTVPLVPWIEMVIGALLLVQLFRPAMAAAAAVLLVLFTIMLLRKLAAGERPPCACFGAWSAKPIGWGHIARNAGLLCLAGAALLG